MIENNVIKVLKFADLKKGEYTIFTIETVVSELLYIAYILSLTKVITNIETFNMNVTIRYTCVLFVIRIIMLVQKYIVTTKGKNLNGKIMIKLKNRFMDTILKMKTEDVENFQDADLLTRFDDDITGIVNLILKVLIQMITAFCVILSIVLYTGVVDWKINIIALVIFPIIFSLSINIGKRINNAADQLQNSKSDMNIYIKDAVNNKLELSIYRANQFITQFVERHIKNTYKNEVNNYNQERLIWLVEMIGYDIFSISYFILSAIIAFQTHKGVGCVAGLMLLNSFLVEKLFELPQLYGQYKESIAKVNRYLEVCKQGHNNEYSTKILDKQPMIEMKQVKYSINKKTILRDVNLRIQYGEKVAIVGKSGAGKSTLIKLLCGYSQNYKGNILIGGNEVKVSNIGFLRTMISYLPQTFNFYNLSIKENLLLLSDKNQLELNDHLKITSMDGEINNLEKKIDTILDNGTPLSGGQIERLNWSMTFMKDTPIRIIDEGFSNIDVGNIEQILDQYIVKENNTCILISHIMNEKILKKFNKIIVVQDGEVDVINNFEELDKYYEYSDF